MAEARRAARRRQELPRACERRVDRRRRPADLAHDPVALAGSVTGGTSANSGVLDIGEQPAELHAASGRSTTWSQIDVPSTRSQTLAVRPPICSMPRTVGPARRRREPPRRSAPRSGSSLPASTRRGPSRRRRVHTNAPTSASRAPRDRRAVGDGASSRRVPGPRANVPLWVAAPGGRFGPMTYVMGVDSSTTATKAVVWDRDGRAVAEGRAEFALALPRPGWHEQDAEDWWRSCAAAVTQALRVGRRHRDRGDLRDPPARDLRLPRRAGQPGPAGDRLDGCPRDAPGRRGRQRRDPPTHRQAARHHARPLQAAVAARARARDAEADALGGRRPRLPRAPADRDVADDDRLRRSARPDRHGAR